jgi:nucleoside 2-deoxyribosyltransferase
MSFRVYVAGSSRELDRAVTCAATLAAAGIVITHRWWDHVIAKHKAGKRDIDLSRDEQVEHARGDLHGVASADAVLCLWPHEPHFSHGMAFECGYANAWCKPLFISGQSAWNCIFTSLSRRFSHDLDALKAVVDLANHRDRYASRISLAGTCPRGEVP